MKRGGYTNGFAAGTFDIFHVGHLRYLQFAKEQCRHLTVGVRGDRLQTPGKPGTAFFPQEIRAELIAGLKAVDTVEIFHVSLDQANHWLTWFLHQRIEIVVIGGDWQGTERWNRLAPLLTSAGIELLFAPRTQGVASRKLHFHLTHLNNANSLRDK
jgi:cytidyltransferase-like protein